MAQKYTRNMIRNVFIEMLDERPFDEITVTDLVTRCEINRKTFYYYYQDLYAVLTEIFESELEAVLGGVKEHVTWEEGIAQAVQIALQHKRAIYHVYHSMQRETLEKYLYNVAGEVMHRYVERQSAGIHASQGDKDIIAQFYQSALTEMVLNWIGQGMKEDGLEMITRMGQLFDGNIRASLKRSESLPVRPWKGGLNA
ncbi:MAG: TetR/AcrR family transcriptional regulator C-terminal domain-containing protein [Clostridiales bacterium]|nr:TetR/AcrR family transcriptional regulator C-terminal domain-containing protein [Clostridiales bacterium]